MSLSDKQAFFTICVTDLLVYARDLGVASTPQCRVRIDYARRCATCNVNGVRNSTHISRLAIDLLLDEKIHGTWGWVQGKHEFWNKLGSFWLAMGKSRDAPTSWGGGFTNRDYGHFSFRHLGVQ